MTASRVPKLALMTATIENHQSKITSLIPTHQKKQRVLPRRPQNQAPKSPKSPKTPHGRPCSKRRRNHSPNKRNSTERVAPSSMAKPRKRRRKRASSASRTLALPSKRTRTTTSMPTLTKTTWITWWTMCRTEKATRRPAQTPEKVSNTPRKKNNTRKSSDGCARGSMADVAALPAASAERGGCIGSMSWWPQRIGRVRKGWGC
mmetsp:Transcript_17923/g.32424  ORF Transcript_17923/g.32424 Transcript_17923/m.32424 type:complete len:204 (-) Transcript_17923:593-1204(-)